MQRLPGRQEVGMSKSLKKAWYIGVAAIPGLVLAASAWGGIGGSGRPMGFGRVNSEAAYWIFVATGISF